MVIKQTKNHKKQKSKYLVNPQNPAESDLGRLAIEAAVLPSLGQVEGQRLLGVAPGEVVGPWVGVTPGHPTSSSDEPEHLHAQAGPPDREEVAAVIRLHSHRKEGVGCLKNIINHINQ